MSKSGSREADADADAGGGEASQRTEEGARRRPPPRRGEEEEERSADRSCVVMVAIARCSGRVELSCGEGSGRTTPSASD